MPTESPPSWFLAHWLARVSRNQAWLVEATGIDKGQISRIVAGKQGWTPTTRRRLADAFRTILPKFRDYWLSDVNPFEPGSDHELIEAIAALPKAKRTDILKMIKAVSEQEAVEPAPGPARPAKKATRKRA